MKYIKSLILFFLLCLMFSCEKETGKTDYRDDCLGDYFFVNIYFDFLDTEELEKDTTYYYGRIAKSSFDSIIIIDYDIDKSIEVKLKRSKEIESISYGSSYSSGLKGWFSNDSIFLYRREGGLGGGWSHDLLGIKQ